MTTLTDLQTTAQLLTQAVNQLGKTYSNIEGTATVAAISSPTVVKSSAGRVCNVSVTTAGSASGMIYDATLASNLVRPIWTIAPSVGLVRVNLPTSYGIVVVPGTGQTLSVSYS
jgi:hypothetical protein